MNSFENTLKFILFRRDCPPDMELGEYELGLLETARRDEIADHLALCPHCQSDLQQIRQFMAVPAVGVEAELSGVEGHIPLLERIKVIVVNLTTPSREIPGALSLQPVFRGTEEVNTRVVEADEYVISLTSEADDSGQATQFMMGDIIHLGDDEEDYRDWTANLWRMGKLLASTNLAADSHFMFADLPVEDAAHELILSGPTVEIHLQNFHIA